VTAALDISKYKWNFVNRPLFDPIRAIGRPFVSLIICLDDNFRAK